MCISMQSAELRNTEADMLETKLISLRESIKVFLGTVSECFGEKNYFNPNYPENINSHIFSDICRLSVIDLSNTENLPSDLFTIEDLAINILAYIKQGDFSFANRDAILKEQISSIKDSASSLKSSIKAKYYIPNTE